MNEGSTSTSGTTRRATVMFADISGFTALGARLDPEEVIGIINGCFERLEEIVYAHGGAIDEYLGDCVKAAFGLSLMAGDGAKHAVDAAIAIRDAVAQYNVDRGIEPPLGVHVGLGTGAIATVPTGSKGLNTTCVMGEAARLASRLEDVSERGQIFVGDETRAATESQFEYRRVQPEDYDSDVPIFELLGEIPRSERKRASERRRATIVFADLIGTDDIASDPRDLEVEMEGLFRDMHAAVVEYGGVVNQYTGDGVMAVFGIPNAIDDAPKQAVNAALRIRERVAGYAERRRSSLSVHLGVNTGLVIAGEIGGSIRKSFTGVGDPVNMSARMKEAAPPGEIYVGPATWQRAREHFEFEELEPMKFKGKTAPVPVYRLASETRQIHRGDDAGRGRLVFSQMVGRDPELGQLGDRISGLESGRGGAISVIAEAGLGKSRLLSEALSRANQERVAILPARSVSVGAGLSFHPFVDLLRGWASIDDQDSETGALAKLTQAMTVMGEGADEALPFVATLLGLRPAGAAADRIATMDGDAIERLVTKSLRDLLASLASARPTIVVMEDVHWADRSSVSLIESLLPATRSVPLLFCFVMRPDFTPGEQVLRDCRSVLGDEHTEVELRPLDPNAIQSLIHNLLDIEDLPESVRTTMSEKAGGNPFFIEEVIRELVDRGAVSVQDGRFKVTEKIDDLVIPGTVQEVIMVRIDRLDESKRHILQIASVIGRSFSYAIIADLVDVARTLPDDLVLLRDKQLLVERTPRWEVPVGDPTILEELEYVFHHALAQETIYSSILQQTRRELHGRVAAVIESRFSDRLKEFFGTLSYHYLQAGDLPKAEDYSFRAGEEAARAGASREALEYFREAERLDRELRGDDGDPGHRGRLDKNIGLALMNTGQLPESLPHFDQALLYLGERVPRGQIGIQGKFALDLASVVGDIFLWRYVRRRRRGTESDHEFFEILNARARASVTSDPRRIFYDNIGGVRRMNRIEPEGFAPACPMYAVAGGMFSFSGLSFGLAARFLERAKSCRTPGTTGDTFDCRSLEYTINYLSGVWRDEDLLDAAFVNDAVRSGLFWDVQNYLGLACDRLQRQGRFAEAQALLAKLAELRDDYDFAFAGTNYEGESAMFHLERRDLEAGRASAERYLDGRDEYALRVLALGTQAKILAHAGDAAGCDESLSEAQAILDTADVIPPWHASTHAIARLHREVDRLSSLEPRERKNAAKRVHAARRGALRLTQTVASQRTEALRLAGTASWLLGRRSQALRSWSESVRFGTSLGARPELARTFAEAARRLEGDERIEGLSAAGCRERAREIFEELDLRWDLDRL